MNTVQKNIHRSFIRTVSAVAVIAASAAGSYAITSSGAFNGLASQGIAVVGGFASAHFSGSRGALEYPSKVATTTGASASAAAQQETATTAAAAPAKQASSAKTSTKAATTAKNSDASISVKAAASTTALVNASSNASVGSSAAVSAAPASNEKRFTAYTTGYGWPDNTPKGSAEISNPIVHTLAGGTGTYADPITLAVGHSIVKGDDLLDYPAGTKFYIPNLRKYFIAEDTCGDGNTPQNGPCHTGYQGHVWLDLWVGGNSSNQKATLACEDDITDLHLVIENPASNYAVVPGDIASMCTNFGDTVVTK